MALRLKVITDRLSSLQPGREMVADGARVKCRCTVPESLRQLSDKVVCHKPTAICPISCSYLRRSRTAASAGTVPWKWSALLTKGTLPFLAECPRHGRGFSQMEARREAFDSPVRDFFSGTSSPCHKGLTDTRQLPLLDTEIVSLMHNTCTMQRRCVGNRTNSSDP